MKIFDGEPEGSKYNFSFGAKVNFVDEKNVFLGYDMGQDCCEFAGWFVADEPTDSIPEATEPNPRPDLDRYVFDQSYFKEVKHAGGDEGGMAIFRIHDGAQEKFLHIFNCHNGYYGHGFTFAVGDQGIREGCL
jgi:hypothetical protein